MWKYTIRVNGMICEKCENNVNDAVRKTFSVKEVTSSYSKNETTVIAENKLDENVLRQVISAAGYQVMSVQLIPMRVKSYIPSESKTMLNVSCHGLAGNVPSCPRTALKFRSWTVFHRRIRLTFSDKTVF